MTDDAEPPLPTPTILVTKLKSQGFFDKTRKRCLEDVESNSDYLNLKACVSGIVSNFLSNQFATGSKIELRERLRRRLQGDASLQRSLNHMADLLLSTYASPESLAPSINQMTCESLKVNYQEWLNITTKPQNPPPLMPSTSVTLSQIAEPGTVPLLPDPISAPAKKKPLLPTAPDLHIPPLKTEPSTHEILSEENDVEMEVDDPGVEMEVESSDSNLLLTEFQSSVDHQPINSSRHADTPHKITMSEPLTSVNDNPPGFSVPAATKNSSSFSKKISTISRSATIFSEPLDAISDNETTGEYSPLRRRMSLVGNPVKQDSSLPPSAASVQASILSPKQRSLDRNPSPHADRKSHAPSSPRIRGFRDHKSSSHHDSSRNHDRSRRDHNRDNYKWRGRDHRFDQYRDTERQDRVDRHSFNAPSRSGVGVLERQIRNPSPVVESRSGSRNLLSRSQSPTTSWRQRQNSPHSMQTLDSRVPNFCKLGKPDSSRGRRDTPHGRDYDRHQQRKQSSQQYARRRHGGDRDRHSRRHSRESLASRRSSPHQSRHRDNRRQNSPIPSVSTASSLSPSRKSSATSAPKTSSRPTGFSF